MAHVMKSHGNPPWWLFRASEIAFAGNRGKSFQYFQFYSEMSVFFSHPKVMRKHHQDHSQGIGKDVPRSQRTPSWEIPMTKPCITWVFMDFNPQESQG